RTLFRAKEKLGVEARHNKGFGKDGAWFWVLPEPPPAIDCQDEHRSPIESDGNLWPPLAIYGNEPGRLCSQCGTPLIANGLCPHGGGTRVEALWVEAERAARVGAG